MSFDPNSVAVSKYSLRYIGKIVRRGQANGWIAGPVDPKHWYSKQTAIKDLIVVHGRCCKMDFIRWLSANDFNFLHDLSGIARHMDRETGDLKNEFRPRFAKKEKRYAK